MAIKFTPVRMTRTGNQEYPIIHHRDDMEGTTGLVDVIASISHVKFLSGSM